MCQGDYYRGLCIDSSYNPPKHPCIIKDIFRGSKDYNRGFLRNALLKSWIL